LEVRNRLGIPDWMNESAYPSVDELNTAEWRWEFLRRNDNYRSDFSVPDDMFFPHSKARYFEDTYYVKSIYDPRQSIREMKLPTGDPITDALLPAGSTPVGFRDYELHRYYASDSEIERRFLHDMKATDLFLRIDLLRPLKPQFERLAELARNAQRSWRAVEVRRPRKDHWPTYLRVVDAHAVGESLSTIASNLLPHTSQTPQTGRDALRQAQALCNDWPY
jgi:hypothetical protein